LSDSRCRVDVAIWSHEVPDNRAVVREKTEYDLYDPSHIVAVDSDGLVRFQVLEVLIELVRAS
jgi:hypothetical protein